MASSTYTVSRRQLYDDVPGLGFSFTAASVTTTTVTTTDPRLNAEGSSIPSNLLHGGFLFRPDVAAADQIRSVSPTGVSFSAGTVTITHNGPDYTDLTDTNVEWVGIHPTELRRLFNDALEFEYVECMIPLYHGPTDADMVLDNVTNWAATNATSAKQTTAAEVFRGARSLSVTNSAANGYAQSGLVRVGQGEAVTAYAIAKADTGQGEFAILDDSGNEEDAVNFTQEQWVFIKKVLSLETTDEGVRFRLRGDGASDQIDWQYAWFVRTNESWFLPPTWIDERYKVKALAYAIPRQGGREADTWLAESLEYKRLQEGPDYRFSVRQADANPYAIWVDPSYLTYPLFMIVDAPYSAPYGVDATFSSESSTTNCPLHLLMSHVKYVIGRRYPSQFQGLERQGLLEARDRRRARQTERPPLEEWVGPTVGMG